MSGNNVFNQHFQKQRQFQPGSTHWHLQQQLQAQQNRAQAGAGLASGGAGFVAHPGLVGGQTVSAQLQQQQQQQSQQPSFPPNVSGTFPGATTKQQPMSPTQTMTAYQTTKSSPTTTLAKGKAATKSKTTKPRVRGPKAAGKSKGTSKAAKGRSTPEFIKSVEGVAAGGVHDEIPVLAVGQALTAGQIQSSKLQGRSNDAIGTKEKKKKKYDKSGSKSSKSKKDDASKAKMDSGVGGGSVTSEVSQGTGSRNRKQQLYTLRFQEEFNNLMIVHGFKKQNDETTQVLEAAVRRQVIEMTRKASDSTRIRGARNMTVDDLMFACRRNKVVTHKLAEFIAQKEARKKMGRPTQENRLGVQQRSKWLLLSTLNDLTSEIAIPLASPEVESMIDELDEERVADQITKGLNSEGYKEYLEAKKGCNFTFKKTRKFREWVDLSAITEFKGNDDFYETLGYIAVMITAEMLSLVKKITPPESPYSGEHLHEVLRRLGNLSTLWS